MRRDRSACGRFGFRGRPVHQDVDVPPDQPAGGEEHESGDEERCDRVAPRIAGRRGGEAGEYRERAREVAAEVDRVRAQGLAAVLARRAKRDDGAREVDREHDRHDDEQPPRRVDRVARPSREPRDRECRDGDADEREHGRLRQRGKVLSLPVPVLMPFVGGPAGDADREEREQRGNEIRSGVQRLGDEPEAAADETRSELECGEHRRRADRDERGSALGTHARKAMRPASAILLFCFRGRGRGAAASRRREPEFPRLGAASQPPARGCRGGLVRARSTRRGP